MPATLVEFPFDSGASEAADPNWTPGEQLVRAENCRLDKDGLLGPRPAYTAMNRTLQGLTDIVFDDLIPFGEELIGTFSSVTSVGRSAFLVRYLKTFDTWAEPVGYHGGGYRLEDVDVFGEPPQAISAVHIAENGNSVLSVTRAFGTTADSLENIAINLHDKSQRQHISNSTATAIKTAVVSLGSVFLIFLCSATQVTIKIQTTVAPWSSSTVVLAGVGSAGVRDVHAAPLTATECVVAFADISSLSTIVFRINSSGASVGSFTAFATDSHSVTVCAANSAGTNIYVARQVSATNAYQAQTYTDAGVSVVGPTTLFAGAISNEHRAIRACYLTGTTVAVVANAQQTMTTTPDTGCRVVGVLMISSTHSVTRNILESAARLQAGPTALGTSGILLGITSISPSGADLTDTLYRYSTSSGDQPSIYCFRNPTISTQQGLSGGAVSDIRTSDGGTSIFWGGVRQGNVIGTSYPIITRTDNITSFKKQFAVVGGQLHIAGTLPLVYDGSRVFEQGFAQKPALYGVTSGSAGGLTASVRYSYRAIWEYIDAQGRVSRSAASNVLDITMGAATRCTIVLASPISMKGFFTKRFTGSTLRLALFRTLADGGNFFREQTVLITNTAVDQWVGIFTFDSTLADSSISTNEVLYEQSQTPVPHVSPPSFEFIATTRDRVIIAGLPDKTQWMQSKLLFPNEPVTFAPLGRLGFSGNVAEKITAVGAFENVALVFTKNRIFQIPGRGPEHSGTGDFDSPLEVPTPGGCLDWRSLLLTPMGYFFQMTSDKLMLLARSQGGAGEVSWVGQPVRDTLAAFPLVKAATYVKSQMLAVFGCNNSDNTQGRLLCFDLRRNVWYVDNPGVPLQSLCEFDNRLAILDRNGLPYLQDSIVGGNAFVPLTIDTAKIAIAKRSGWGQVYRVGLVGQAKGPCTVTAFIDVHRGAGFESLGAEVFAGTEGDFTRLWSLGTAHQRCQNFTLRFTVTHAGTNSAGVQLRAWAVEVEGSKQLTRTGSTGVVS